VSRAILHVCTAFSTLACGAGGAPAGDDSAATFCSDAPVVTWETFGHGFVTEHCQACHASTTLERNGAPRDVSFDTHDEVLALTDRILARSVGPAASMPPQGGVTPDDRQKLEIWLRCWEDA